MKRTRLPKELTLTIRQLITQGKSASEISKMTGVGKGTVANHAIRAGLKIQHADRGPKANHVQLRAIQALAHYVPNRSHLARILGVTQQAVCYSLKKARLLPAVENNNPTPLTTSASGLHPV